MAILGFLIFVSLTMAVAAVILFTYSAKNNDLTQGDQISLLPLEDDNNE